jgi:hypothetical protein
MLPRRFIRATAPGAVHGRPKDGVASRAYARPDAALILGGLLLLICP